MIKTATYDIQVKDSIVNPNQLLRKGMTNVYYKKTRGTKANNMYKVHIYLTGNDLAFVKSTTYVLHKTFSNPVQKVERSLNNTNCMLTIWTWGIFTIKVIIEDINGNILRREHKLSYGREIQENDDNLNWVKE
ncbi:MAG: pYEATS domain-containing protein [Gilvibacter sp.]